MDHLVRELRSDEQLTVSMLRLVFGACLSHVTNEQSNDLSAVALRPRLCGWATLAFHTIGCISTHFGALLLERRESGECMGLAHAIDT